MGVQEASKNKAIMNLKKLADTIMNSQALEAIESKIKGSLINCYINKQSPQFESFYEHVKSLEKEVLKHKKEWIGKNDVITIFYECVLESILEYDDELLTGNLWDLLGEEKGNKLKEKIKDIIKSIPKTYSIYIPLPSATVALENDIKIGGNISIKIFDDAKQVPGTGHFPLFPSYLNEPKQKVFIQQTMHGYCEESFDNLLIIRAYNNFKILVGFGIITEIFELTTPIHYKLKNSLMDLFSHHQIIKSQFIIEDQTGKNIKKMELPIDICKLLSSIGINKTVTEDKILTNLKFAGVLTECEVAESKRIKSSIQWFFDSHSSENRTLAFLQVCIGLEALLGDDGYNGALTEKLADRCSYLIGTNIKGRKIIKEKFLKLYDIRSALVHGNATELSKEQKDYLEWGRDVLKAAILSEIQHLGLC